MLMVVLGAGASHDAFNPSIENYGGPWRPPLADDLFGNRAVFSNVIRDRYPQALVAVRRLRERVGQGAYVETALAEMLAEAGTYPPLKTAMAAIRFYLQDIVDECGRSVGLIGFTNHVSLVSQLDQWRHGRQEPVLYVTFNYDTLVEQACQIVLKKRYAAMDAYVDDARAAIVKLHGSVDWWHPVENPFPGGGSLDSLRTALIEAVGSVAVVDDVFEWHVAGNLVRSNDGAVGGLARLSFPALAIPIELKDGFVCPESHLGRLRSLLSRVDRLICIGWRAREADFLELMMRTLAGPIAGLVVTATEAGALRVRERLSGLPDVNWAPDVTSQTQSPSAGAFSKMVTDGFLSRFLADEVSR